jgi:TolB-like protein/Tfp pilus assembly protein PilF
MYPPKQFATPVLPQPRASSPDPDAVRAHLQKILAWEPFVRSQRLSRFLRYTVEQALENPTAALKEFVIAVEVFDKPKTFDPRLDPIVRVEARRLRTRVSEYYQSAGQNDEVRILYEARGYKPVFEVAIGATEDGLRNDPHAIDEPSSTSIAVLPFVDLSPEGDAQNLCASLTEELINALGRSTGLRVVSRTSTRRYEGKSFDIRQAGQLLGVDCVLEGSIRKDTNRIRIAAQLYSVSDGLELWSRVYERPNTDTFGILAEIAVTIADSLEVQLTTGGEAPGVPPSRTSPRAYRMYLRGLQFWRNSDNPARAIRNLERAIAEEPGFAAAHAGLAHAYTFLAWFKEMRPAEAWPRAEAAAAAALKLDPSHAAAHAVAACNQALFQWNWQEAERAFLRAIELSPGDALPHEWYACACLAPQRRLDEAAAEIEQAQALEPLSPMVQCHAGLIHFYRGDYVRARQLLMSVLDIEPEFWPALWTLGRVAIEEGDLLEAEAVLGRAKRAAGESAEIVTGHLGLCYARKGEDQRARLIAAELIELSKSRYISPLHLARIYIGLGEFEPALDRLEAARQHRCTHLVELMVAPIYRPLYNEPRFQEVARAVGVPILQPA